MSQSPPRLFISYRWSNPPHEAWVLELASALRGDGVDVILDKWHLREGQDTYAFMESMVSDTTIRKVLLVCDEGYVQRANSRQGGVGTEAQIVSSEVYSKVEQTKFAAAVCALDREGSPLLPIYMSTRLYFDFCGTENFSNSYQQLVRWCFDKPFHVAPPVGKPPAYLTDTFKGPIIAQFSATRLSAAHSRGEPAMLEAAKAYLEDVAKNSTNLIISVAGIEAQDQPIFDAIESIVPTIDDTLQAISVIANSKSDDTVDIIHSFIESIAINIENRPEGDYTVIDNDALKFFVHFIFVGTISLLMKLRKFDIASSILNTPFYFRNHQQTTGRSVGYGYIRNYLASLEETRKNRLQLNRISVHADLIVDIISKCGSIKLDEFMEADFTLYLRNIVGNGLGLFADEWYPTSCLYAASSAGSFPSFARGSSLKFYDRFKIMIFDCPPDEIRRQLEDYRTGKKKSVRFNYNHLPVYSLSNAQNLGTQS